MDAYEDLLKTLGARFAANMPRHPGLAWGDVEARLRAHPDKLRVLAEMERTGGEPDAIGAGAASGSVVYCDCAAESPAGRRSLCYDRAALDARKENKPRGSAMEMAAAIGIEILDEAAYRELQTLFAFDCKTSSWIATPAAIRKKGGALFCDRRFDHVFVYHNGVESYYAGRGFRGRIEI
jgi:hypothetical protein